MFYIQDDRYRTSTLDVVLADDDGAAHELATLCLASSPHYLSIEVWEEERMVIQIEKGDGFPSAPKPDDEAPPGGSAEAI